MANEKKVMQQDAKIDEAIKETFPASDPPSVGKPTSTEPAAAPASRKAPIIRKEDVEAAQRADEDGTGGQGQRSTRTERRR